MAKKTGRPTIYSDGRVREICELIAKGQPLTKICARSDMPDYSTVITWISSNDEFAKMYARARQDQADTMADQIIEIADEAKGLSDNAAVQAAKLRVDARKWVAAKLKPRKYGDALAARLASDGSDEVTLCLTFGRRAIPDED